MKGLFNNIKRKDNYKTEKPSFRADQIGLNSQPCHANRAVVEIKKKRPHVGIGWIFNIWI
jgi:hypothetical protein